VIVPAYNEGAMVRVALVSALENDYPADKLHVVAIDDGSTDDTWSHIVAVAGAFPGRITPVRQSRNGGKREALRAGFLRADGEVLVTLDSDSKLATDAIRNIVAPIVHDPAVAAVAGKVLVLNRYANLLTRLLAARFFVTFDLVRAAQSRFGAVLCTPGALSAYRRSAVMTVLRPWSTQSFLGTPCTIGEDRALTTWLLRAGHRALYQSTAVVHTLVPTTARGMARMFVRWERGNIREDLVMLPVLATPWRRRDRWWPTFEIAFNLLQYPVGYLALALLVGWLARHPLDLAWLAASVGLTALVQSLYCLRTERGTDFLYGVGYAFVAFVGLQWVFPYSCLTLRNGRWLTR
jgi:hyaluronan synthase